MTLTAMRFNQKDSQTKNDDLSKLWLDFLGTLGHVSYEYAI